MAPMDRERPGYLPPQEHVDPRVLQAGYLGPIPDGTGPPPANDGPAPYADASEPGIANSELGLGDMEWEQLFQDLCEDPDTMLDTTANHGEEEATPLPAAAADAGPSATDNLNPAEAAMVAASALAVLDNSPGAAAGATPPAEDPKVARNAKRAAKDRTGRKANRDSKGEFFKKIRADTIRAAAPGKNQSTKETRQFEHALAVVTDLEQQIGELTARNSSLEEQNSSLDEQKSSLEEQNAALMAMYAEVLRKNAALEEQVNRLTGSTEASTAAFPIDGA